MVGTCLILGLFSIVVPRLIQWRGERLVTLVSGSMEPTYMTGETIRIIPAASLTTPLAVGDAVTFAGANGTLVTHRIVEFVTLPSTPVQHIRTKGDRLAKADPFITPVTSVVGQVQGSLRPWESFALGLQDPIPRAIIFAIPLLSLLLTELLNMGRILRDAARKAALEAGHAHSPVDLPSPAPSRA